MNEQTILQRSDQVTFQTVAGEAVLIRMDTGTYFSLNPVGTDFWERINGQATIADIAAAIVAKYNAQSDRFAATLADLAQRQADETEQQAAAAEFTVDLAVVQENQAQIAAGVPAAAIAESFYVTPNLVIGDLLELAAEMQAEKLVMAR